MKYAEKAALSTRFSARCSATSDGVLAALHGRQ
jgi:hypothetical protein